MILRRPVPPAPADGKPRASGDDPGLLGVATDVDA